MIKSEHDSLGHFLVDAHKGKAEVEKWEPKGKGWGKV